MIPLKNNISTIMTLPPNENSGYCIVFHHNQINGSQKNLKNDAHFSVKKYNSWQLSVMKIDGGTMSVMCHSKTHNLYYIVPVFL